MPAARKPLEILERLEDAVIGHGGVHDAVRLQREQCVGVAGRRHAEGTDESGQLAGIVTHLVRVRHVDADQLEIWVGVDAGQGMAPDVTGAPLHDTVRHEGWLL